LVHVDVDDGGARLDLLARDVQRGAVVAGDDQFLELGRSGDIGPLADIDESGAHQAYATQPRQERPWNTGSTSPKPASRSSSSSRAGPTQLSWVRTRSWAFFRTSGSSPLSLEKRM